MKGVSLIQRLDSQCNSGRNRVEVVQGSGEEASTILGEGSFDAVLCHGVLMYLEEPRALIRALAMIMRPRAMLSVLAKNAEALAMRPALQGRFDDALAAFDADRDVGGLGVVTRGDTVVDLARAFHEVGVELEEWYGVRVLTDHLGNQPPVPDLRDVLRVEWEAGRREPYRRIGRLLHLIGRRR